MKAPRLAACDLCRSYFDPADIVTRPVPWDPSRTERVCRGCVVADELARAALRAEGELTSLKPASRLYTERRRRCMRVERCRQFFGHLGPCDGLVEDLARAHEDDKRA